MVEVIREIRFQGSHRQHVMAAATLFSRAALLDGLSARVLAPGGAAGPDVPEGVCVHICGQPLDSREEGGAPDAVVIQNHGILRSRTVLQGIKPGGIVVVNGNRRWVGRNGLLYWVILPVSEIDRPGLGEILSDSTLLGALAAATGWVSLEALEQAMREHFAVKKVVEGNHEALHRGFREAVEAGLPA